MEKRPSPPTSTLSPPPRAGPGRLAAARQRRPQQSAGLRRGRRPALPATRAHRVYRDRHHQPDDDGGLHARRQQDVPGGSAFPPGAPWGPARLQPGRRGVRRHRLAPGQQVSHPTTSRHLPADPPPPPPIPRPPPPQITNTATATPVGGGSPVTATADPPVSITVTCPKATVGTVVTPQSGGEVRERARGSGPRRARPGARRGLRRPLFPGANAPPPPLHA
jgi:hypothetical protein